MSYLPEADPGKGFEPFLNFEKYLGRVPNLFRAQTLLPRVIEAEARIARAILFQDGALSRIRKERLLLTLAADRGSVYCVTAHGKMLEGLGVPEAEIQRLVENPQSADLPKVDGALLDFCMKLNRRPSWISAADIANLRQSGCSDEVILEAILTSALTSYLCVLSRGLGVAPDFEPRRWTRQPIPSTMWSAAGSAGGAEASSRGNSPGYLSTLDLAPESFPPFALFRRKFGFVPNIFRAQTLRPDVLEAEAAMVEAVLLSEKPLDRVRKEYILLVISAANLNTYCVAVHCEMLKGLGIPEEQSEQIAVDHRQASLSEADAVLLDCALKLTLHPEEFSERDIATLRSSGFSDLQILDGIVMISLTNFLNTLQMGLGTLTDFEPRLRFPAEIHTGREYIATPAAPGASKSRAAAGPEGVDEDLPLVTRAREGDLEAYEGLVAKHKGRIYQTILGITGRAEDAEDGTQEALVKAYQHLGDFQGNSRFSTWLTRIAINEGLMILRRRKDEVSLEEGVPDEDEGFRPRQLQAWGDDPEELTSQDEIRILLESEILKLPERYRAVVVLRDLSGLSTEEAAKALGLGIPALKTRLFRGHLLLREALAPHFTHRQRGNARA
ncbi:MAG: peroxidase-related enzyme [Acidobacteria bacterium]|nr:peroxidase-related enzyme [Acidobacteriota bacterium]